MQKFHRRLRHSFLDAFGDTDDEYLSRVQARAIEKPDLVSQNNLLALDMGLDKKFLEDSKTLDFFCGNSVPDDIQPIALVYSGHQFGVWAGQLGDDARPRSVVPPQDRTSFAFPLFLSGS